MFDKQAIIDAKEHALRENPYESCGFIIDGKYYPMKNISDSPIDTFRIDPIEYLKAEEIGNIECVIHSHKNYPHTSKLDMESQKRLGIPFGIINIDKGNKVQEPFFWGQGIPVSPYIGRKFIIGVHDCYGLLRDYYRNTLDIEISDYPRDEDWWFKGPSMLTDYYGDEGFYDIKRKELKEGDVIFMKIKTNITNHCGIYLGNNLILHHLVGRLSCRQPIGMWDNYITNYLRHKDR